MRCLTLLLVLLMGTASAQDAAPLRVQGLDAYRAGDYAESARLFAASLAAGDRDTATAYNAACAASLAGQTEAAFAHLAVAARLGFVDADLMRADTDLARLHDDPRWPAALGAVQAGQDRLAQLWGSPALRTPYRADLTEDEKTAGLSRLWSEVKFNFANFDLVPRLDWDSLYVAALPLVRETTSTRDYYRVLSGVVAQLRDGHTNVFYPAALAAEVHAGPLLQTRLVDGHVLVGAVYADSLVAAGLVPGLEVVAVDGVPVHDYARANVRPYQSAGTPQDLDVQTYEYALLHGPAGGPVSLTLESPDGRTVVHTVARVSPERRRARIPAAPPFALEWLPGRVAHVRLTSFGTAAAAEQFVAAFPEIAGAAAIVLDIRENGGGDSGVGWDVLATLAAGPFQTSAWQTREYRPAERAWGLAESTFGEAAGTWPADPAHHYDGPVAVLVGPRTYSAAEDFAVAFDAMDRGPIVGEPTGGSTGQPLAFALPGGGSARVVTKRDRYPDGRDFVGVGVRPVVVVRPSVADVRAGRDPALEAALARLGVR